MHHSLITLIAVVLGLLIPGCVHPPALTEDAKLKGLTAEELVARFGIPPHFGEYRMADAPGEFRTALQKHFPMPESREVRIRELTWDFSECHITAWLHHTNAHWVAFDSLRYQKGVQF